MLNTFMPAARIISVQILNLVLVFYKNSFWKYQNTLKYPLPYTHTRMPPMEALIKFTIISATQPCLVQINFCLCLICPPGFSHECPAVFISLPSNDMQDIPWWSSNQYEVWSWMSFKLTAFYSLSSLDYYLLIKIISKTSSIKTNPRLFLNWVDYHSQN